MGGPKIPMVTPAPPASPRPHLRFRAGTLAHPLSSDYRIVCARVYGKVMNIFWMAHTSDSRRWKKDGHRFIADCWGRAMTDLSRCKCKRSEHQITEWNQPFGAAVRRM